MFGSSQHMKCCLTQNGITFAILFRSFASFPFNQDYSISGIFSSKKKAQEPARDIVLQQLHLIDEGDDEEEDKIFAKLAKIDIEASFNITESGLGTVSDDEGLFFCRFFLFLYLSFLLRFEFQALPSIIISSYTIE